MTSAELKAVIVEGLRQVAPESDPASLAPDQPVRETLGIDSYDFLNFLVGLHKTLGIEIPEADYGQLGTIDGMIRYLAPKI
jgi:acyl carrier protein